MARRRNQQAKKKGISDWADDFKETRGTACGTCKCSQEIQDAIIEFDKIDREGGTSATWAAFHRDYLKPVLGYKLSVHSLKRHLWDCVHGQD